MSLMLRQDSTVDGLYGGVRLKSIPHADDTLIILDKFEFKLEDFYRIAKLISERKDAQIEIKDWENGPSFVVWHGKRSSGESTLLFRSTDSVVDIGPLDLREMLRYLMINTNLSSDDPRMKIIEMDGLDRFLPKYTIVDGYGFGGHRGYRLGT